MAAFEYRIVTSTDSDEDDEMTLNDLGGEGWELVGVRSSEVVVSYSDGAEPDADEEEEAGEDYVEEVVIYYLKREKA